MKILIVDDEKAIRNSLGEILGDEGYEVDTAEDGPAALAKVDKERFDVIFCDIKMPGMDGTEVLDKLVADGIDSAIVMISGHGDIETAVECIKKGAFDFIQKPLDLNRILITIKNATERVSIVKENRQLKKKVYGQKMVGESEPIRHIRDMITKVAPTDSRVLIMGPNGSGKTTVLRLLDRLYPDYEGNICIGDENGNDIYVQPEDEVQDKVFEYFLTLIDQMDEEEG